MHMVTSGMKKKKRIRKNEGKRRRAQTIRNVDVSTILGFSQHILSRCLPRLSCPLGGFQAPIMQGFARWHYYRLFFVRPCDQCLRSMTNNLLPVGNVDTAGYCCLLWKRKHMLRTIISTYSYSYKFYELIQ